MAANRRLIVDVGMHRGEDTEFYLAKGFDVLAVEAVPTLVAEVSDRLRPYVDSGRLTIANTAIAEQPGMVRFHVSDHEGWGSLTPDRAGASLNVGVREIEVPADTLDRIVGTREPYYVKIDIEGADLICLEQVERLATKPQYVSFECDLTRRNDTLAALDRLGRLGYQRFKLVNQALNPELRCPDPPLEGSYVDATFTHYMSGPFGEETPGDWVGLDEISDRYARVSRQQAARATYAETGRVLGIPIGRFHRLLEAVYNAGPVVRVRRRYAKARGAETGGWFDIHAAR